MDYYIVDAFADKVFEGNPAGVCVVDEWPDDALMQNIAFENNLSETAFVAKRNGYYDLRWFTPTVEVELCGHATVGAAYAVANFVEPDATRMRFMTQSGELTVTREGDLYELDFPAKTCQKAEIPASAVEALGVMPLEAWRSRDLMLVLDSPETVRLVEPDFARLLTVETGACVIVTAKGNNFDFVSRVFCPKMGINEDPVCGSAHCTLIPFWAQRLDKDRLTARQISQRGGTLHCHWRGERVGIAGKAALYLKGEIFV